MKASPKKAGSPKVTSAGSKKPAAKGKVSDVKNNPKKQKKEKQPTNPDDEPEASEHDDDHEGNEESEAVLAKKNAHRLYMKFWRNVHQSWGFIVPERVLNLKLICI